MITIPYKVMYGNKKSLATSPQQPFVIALMDYFVPQIQIRPQPVCRRYNKLS